jgi:hypothetical protein
VSHDEIGFQKQLYRNGSKNLDQIKTKITLPPYDLQNHAPHRYASEPIGVSPQNVRQSFKLCITAM